MTVTLPERPADLAEPRPDLAALRSAIEDLVGDRAKVEILGGDIIVAPMPRNIHLLTVTLLDRLLTRSLPDAYVVSERFEFAVDESNSPQPDLAIVPLAAVREDLEALTSRPSEALLVIEVTSPSNAPNDRKWGLKYKAYAKGLVPVYLLIDPYAQDGPSVTLFTDPTGTRYKSENLVPFGKKLSLPEPFDAVVIDTSTFPVPPSS
jgi:Uma2 family endonuclease